MNQQAVIRDLFDPEIRFSILEAAPGEVDGVHVLAKVKGEFFFPDGKSRNKRFYPKKAWENVIADPATQSRLQRRLMFGTIGHDQELNDKAVREGMISHFMSKIYIEDGKGIGEAFIMNTPVGQILNTMMRAGSQLSVSSRADGRFKGQYDGMPSIDPDNFSLIGWDFVIDPGFLEANPVIAEAYKKTIEETKNDEDENMSGEKDSMNKLVEHITTENHDLKDKNGTLTTENTGLRESNNVLAEENKHLKEEIAAKAESTKTLESYQAVGSVEEIQQVMTVAEKSANLLKQYEALGTPEDIRKAFEATSKHVTEFREKFGSEREVAQVFSSAKKLNERLLKIGSIDEIEKLTESFGTLIKEAEELKDQAAAQEAEKAAQELAAEIGADVADVAELLKTKTADEVKAMYAKVEENLKKKHNIKNESKVADPAPSAAKWQKKQVNEGKDQVSKIDLSESSILGQRGESDESSVLGKSRIERMNEHFAK